MEGLRTLGGHWLSLFVMQVLGIEFRLLLGFLQAESSLGVERSHEQVHSFGTCDTFDAIDVVCVTFS